MFTGLIEEKGVVREIEARNGALRFDIAGRRVLEDLKIDDSISVNGVCLTTISVSGQQFSVEAVEETLKKTTLSELKQGARVNLERALRFSDRLGGHLVQGHVDGVGQVTSMQNQEGAVLLSIRIPESLARYVISEGSISVNGVSLTVARLQGNQATIALIPHTLEMTNLGDLEAGAGVNIEGDLIGKYVEKLLGQKHESNITEKWLQKAGYGA
jgi:riboflavin synthase